MKNFKKVINKGFCVFIFFPLGILIVSCSSSSSLKEDFSQKRIFFDDFTYNSISDTNFKNFGWHARSGAGNPGPEGAIWSSNLVSFMEDSGNKYLQLEAEIKEGQLTQSEVNFKEHNMFEGTYAARVYYTNEPDSGEDGAELCQAGFWLMSNYQETTKTDLYSEYDFEYLPNGGWGFDDEPVMHFTSYYQDIPRDNIHNAIKKDFSGWHTLLIVVSNGVVKYYDGDKLLAEHGGKFYPRSNMNIISQLWFIDNVDTSIDSKYHINVDWIYYAENKVLNLGEVQNEIEGLRKSNIQRQNNIK